MASARDDPKPGDDDQQRIRRSIGRRDVTEWRSRGGQRLAAANRRVADRVGRRRTVVATAVAGAGVAVAFTWAATYLYDAVTDRDGIADVDVPMLHAGMRLRGPVVDPVVAGIARVFGPVGMPVLALAAGAALALQQRSREPLVVVVAAGAGSLAMTIGGKRVVERHRPSRRDAIPPFERSPSFPSGHTLNATAVTGAVAYLLMLEQRSDRAQVATALVALSTAGAVGMSRVVLGAHWFTDVATGWVLGGGWLSLLITAHRLQRTLTDGPPAATA